MICKLCGYKSNNKNDFFINGKENPTYECAWDLEIACKKTQSENNAATQLKKREEARKNMYPFDEFVAKYNINFDEYELSKTQYRDATRRYVHKTTGDMIINHSIERLWSKPNTVENMKT